MKEALDKGAELSAGKSEGAAAASGGEGRGIGVATGAFTAGSVGFDGLLVIKPDGKMYIQPGVGNLGTES